MPQKPSKDKVELIEGIDNFCPDEDCDFQKFEHTHGKNNSISWKIKTPTKKEYMENFRKRYEGLKTIKFIGNKRITDDDEQETK